MSMKERHSGKFFQEFLKQSGASLNVGGSAGLSVFSLIMVDGQKKSPRPPNIVKMTQGM